MPILSDTILVRYGDVSNTSFHIMLDILIKYLPIYLCDGEKSKNHQYILNITTPTAVARFPYDILLNIYIPLLKYTETS